MYLAYWLPVAITLCHGILPIHGVRVDCQQNIPTDGPAAKDIANALQKNNQLATMCAATFNGSGDSTHATFNHGNIDLTLQRSSPDDPLAFCNDALKAIIHICILSSNYYGGVLYEGGEIYNISNSIYPNNPLIPNIDQGATTPSTPSSPVLQKGFWIWYFLPCVLYISAI